MEDLIEFGEKWLSPPVVEALVNKIKLKSLNQLQKKAIPIIISGRDVLIRSKTGSGKTLAAIIPMVELLTSNVNTSTIDRNHPRAIVLAPTSELCIQMYEVLNMLIEYLQDQLSVVLKISHHSVADNAALSKKYKKLVEKYEIVSDDEYGGRLGDVVICTPTSFINDIKITDIHKYLKFLLIDEGDTLFLMGFEEELKKIVRILRPNVDTKTFQSVVLSATLDDNVEKLNGMILYKYKLIDMPEEPKSGILSQLFIRVNKNDKFLIMYIFLRFSVLPMKCLIFVNAIERAYSLKLLLEGLQIDCTAISPVLALETRTSIINSFNKGTFKVLIACPDKLGGKFALDRGIDFKGINCVVSLDSPSSDKEYIHRIGRTARAGSNGVALTFIEPDEDHFILSNEHVKEIDFPSSLLDQLRYRFEDIMRNVTPNAISSAQLQAISKSAITCSRLKDYFESNRGDYEALQLHATKTEIKGLKNKEHLSLIPSYLLSETLMNHVESLRKIIYNSADLILDENLENIFKSDRAMYKGVKRKPRDREIDYSTTAPEYLPALSKKKKSLVSRSLKALVPKKRKRRIKSKKEKKSARAKKKGK